MQIRGFDRLARPLDGLPLQQQGNALRCADGHSYDRARQGHANLLPVQHKRSRDPGDTVPSRQCA